ncbi:hypothetical protein Cch01nite_20700 [Cellulomonas chitinilytica]|uniref:Uncharacterized protein n=1 Tax=Cellulomonas chitinilytica TaxID=398759 RepID=A0A919P4A0_9CELL|nr:hypothetical protein [Cellulomonas chitinilytica]GIG21346.1 hypothetical protein Cch01nite_20700 [Cellulomonas chitinilytica]
MDTTSTPSLVWHTYTTDAGYVGRQVRAQYRRLLTTPQGWFLTAVYVVLLVIIASAPAGMSVMLVPVVAVMAGAVVWGRVRTGRAIPVGTVVRAALGPHHLHVHGPVVQDVEVRYDAFRRVVVQGRFAVLELRPGRSIVILPLEVLPGPVLDELRARIRDAPGPEDRPVVPRPEGRFTATYVTDEGFARRFARTGFRQLVLTPRKVATLAVAVAVGVLLASGGHLGSDTVVILVVALGTVAVLLWSVLARMHRQLVRRVPVGSTYRAGADDTHLWLDGPVVALELTYAGITDVRTRDEVVFLRQRGTGQWIPFPVQVFPGAALDDLRRRVAAARVAG